MKVVVFGASTSMMVHLLTYSPSHRIITQQCLHRPVASGRLHRFIDQILCFLAVDEHSRDADPKFSIVINNVP